MTPLSKKQWFKVLTALVFSFVSAFLAVLVTAGGLQDTAEANMALVFSAAVAGINAVIYAAFKLFQDDTKTPDKI